MPTLTHSKKRVHFNSPDPAAPSKTSLAVSEWSKMAVAEWLRANWQQCDSRKRPVYLAKIKRERKFDGKHLAKLDARQLKVLARRSLGLKKGEADYESFLHTMHRLLTLRRPNDTRQRSRTFDQHSFAMLSNDEKLQRKLKDRRNKEQRQQQSGKVRVTVHDEKSNRVTHSSNKAAKDAKTHKAKQKTRNQSHSHSVLPRKVKSVKSRPKTQKPSLRAIESDTPNAPKSKHQRTRIAQKYKKSSTSKRSVSSKRADRETVKREQFRKRKSYPETSRSERLVILKQRSRATSPRGMTTDFLDSPALPFSSTSPCGSPSEKTRNRRRRLPTKGKHMAAHSGLTSDELMQLYEKGQDETEPDTESEMEIETYAMADGYGLEMDETPSPLEMGHHLHLLYAHSGNHEERDTASNRTSISSYISSQSAEFDDREKDRTMVVPSILAIEDGDEECEMDGGVGGEKRCAPKIALSPIVSSGLGPYGADEMPRFDGGVGVGVMNLTLMMYSMTDESSDDQSDSSTVRGVTKMTRRIIENCSNRPMSSKSAKDRSGSGSRSPQLTPSSTPLVNEEAMEELDEFINCMSDDE